MDETVLRYWVGSDGSILNIYGPWDDFAVKNKGRFLLKEDVIGKDIFKYIEGEEVRSVYHSIHDAVLQNPEMSVTFDFRCDSPEMKRFLSMEITNDGNLICYKSQLLEEVDFPEQIDIDYSSKKGEIVVMCAWCKKFRYPKDSTEWNSIEHFFQKVPSPFRISHGICGDCKKKIP